MKKIASFMAAMAAAFSTFGFASSAIADEPKICLPEADLAKLKAAKAKCDADLKASTTSLEDCKGLNYKKLTEKLKQVGCDVDVTPPKDGGDTPDINKKKPEPVKQPAKPEPPLVAVKPTPWTCTGPTHIPDKADKASDCRCDDGTKGEQAYVPAILATSNTVMCLPKEAKAAADWISELESDPTLSDPKNKAKRAAKVKEVYDLIFKKPAPTVTAPPADPTIDTWLRDHFRTAMKSLCGIDNIADPKWDAPGAIDDACDMTIAVKIESAKSMWFHVTPTISMGAGPGGMDVAAGVDNALAVGKPSSGWQYLVGVRVETMFVSPKTGDLGALSMYNGWRIFLGDARLRNSFSLDIKLGFSQLLSLRGSNPVFGNRQYHGVNPLWGTIAYGELGLNIRASSWFSVGFGGSLGYGVNVNSVEKDGTFRKDNGVVGRGFLSFTFTL